MPTIPSSRRSLTELAVSPSYAVPCGEAEHTLAAAREPIDSVPDRLDVGEVAPRSSASGAPFA